jgi:hypothetical protein
MQEIRDVADVRARTKALEDHKLPERVAALERFMTGVMSAVAVATAIVGFIGGLVTGGIDGLRKIFGHG